MTSPILQGRRFAEIEGCVLPSVKHQTCRERAVALLAQEFLSRDRSRRLVDPDDIRSHPFFRPVTWEDLEKKRV